jgi:chaperonin GroES
MSAYLDGLTTWEPQHDQLLVRPLTPADRTAGGVLIIPDAARERPHQGVVIAVGPGAIATLNGTTIPVGSKPGDLVAFGKYAGMDFDIDGKLVLIMRDVEALIRRPAGSFALVEHEDGKYAHVAGYVCEHCPKVVSELIEQERARLRQAAIEREFGPNFVPTPAQQKTARENADGEIGAELGDDEPFEPPTVRNEVI